MNFDFSFLPKKQSNLPVNNPFMKNNSENELRKVFQLERMILFSDAVFAIAITVLVIGIKIPEKEEVIKTYGNISNHTLSVALKELIPKFFGFIISFLLIGLYWSVHHRMFGFVNNYDSRLLFLNLVFLFFVVLMPFSTGFYGEYAGSELLEKQLVVPLTFYVLNFCCLGFVNYLMWRHITNPGNKLTDYPIDPVTARYAKFRSLIIPSVFLIMLPVAYLTNVIIAVYIPLLIPLLMKILKKYFIKQQVRLSNKH
ncbi:MAG: hypothetical protein B6D37_14145 [Sphingobacteriales bacterium UTBCD1]|nr:MAG: hypothetical protein B6D37_14145 [Sphingobacteriales bacterium UTBCD1]